MRSKWTQARPCASAAYLVFSCWPNSDARRMLARLGVVQDETKKWWPRVVSDAPDSRFWFRVPLTESRDLETVKRVMRANGLGASYGPYAGCGNIMAPTGAGAIAAHAKPRALRNERYKELERTGAVCFQTVCASIFKSRIPEIFGLMRDLDSLAWRKFGVSFASLKGTNWLSCLYDLTVAKQMESADSLWLDAQTALERDYLPGLDGEKPRRKIRKSETLPNDGAPIVLAMEAKPKFHAHGKRVAKRTGFRWFEMQSYDCGGGI